MTEDNPKRNAPKTQVFLCSVFKKLIAPTGSLIGIDYGTVRIGIAVSDTERQVATPFKIIAKIRELDDIVASRLPAGFVIGMPYQPDGTEGNTAVQVRLFANRLTEKYGLPILFIDETKSSVKAEAVLRHDVGIRERKIKKVLDALVARDLLQKVLIQLKQKD